MFTLNCAKNHIILQMKCTIPEISWHNRDPVLSIDIQTRRNDDNEELIERLATGGTDSHVLIWNITVGPEGAATVEFSADLTRHQRAVNVVRFSPSGELLASGDDDSIIIIWHQDDKDKQWVSLKTLKGHIEDVYDLAWSPDSLRLISGSVDNTAILWDVRKGVKTDILSEHKGFVQGVAWNPRAATVATLSSDRTLRVYSTTTKKCVGRSQRSGLFHDDTFKSFFRRLCYSPDGRLLVAPSGLVAETETTPQSNATHVFTQGSVKEPSVILPSLENFTVAVRCCPLLFCLRDSPCTMLDLPYRMILAVAEQKSVVLYDTQQIEPVAIISNIHYTRLTDLAWSSNGRMLIISSTDGYCSIVTFGDNELGIVYNMDDSADKTTVPGKPDSVDKAAIAERKKPTGTEESGERPLETDVTEKKMNMEVDLTLEEIEKETVTVPMDNCQVDLAPNHVEKPTEVTVNTEVIKNKSDESKAPCETTGNVEETQTKSSRVSGIAEQNGSGEKSADVGEKSADVGEKKVDVDAMVQEKLKSPVTPVARAPRRVALTTLASPKSKKRLM